MKNLILKKTILVVAAFFMTICAASAALACQPCRIEDSLDLKQTVKRADLIVTGNRIFKPEEKLEKEPAFVDLQFLRVLKGKVTENQARARSYFGMCPYGVIVGDAARYVFFLNEIDRAENLFGAVDRCGVKTLRIDAGETVTIEEGKAKISLDELLSEHVAPPEYVRIVKFLQLLKNGEDGDGAFGFDAREGGKWNLEILLSFVSTGGITLSDVNKKPRERRLTFAVLSRSLAGKKDDVWRRFVHLGHIYNQAYPQYSTVTYTAEGNRVVAELTGGYRLTFSGEKNDLKLTKLEYLHSDGD